MSAEEALGQLVVAAATPLAIALGKALVRALEGETKEETAKAVVEALVANIPRETLSAFLTEAGVMRAEVAADIAESRKFDTFSDPADD
jgi:hypothetical protein